MFIHWLYPLNHIYATGGLILLGATFVLFYDYFFNDSALYRRWLAPLVWHMIVVATVGGVISSLVYSEYFGFVPCSLCWLQRIALYPQALLSIMAYRLKEAVYFPLYGIALSLFGIVVGVYQYFYQLVPAEVSGELLPCLADGGVDCSIRSIEVYGFVTFPFLSVVLFLFLTVLYMNLRRETVRSGA